MKDLYVVFHAHMKKGLTTKTKLFSKIQVHKVYVLIALFQFDSKFW